ncbi:MAG TPA: hypothetical protein VFP87_03580 [Chitinophagaceae bacterium]|nr:hypothetical protein [Chitinophagaceae bacterium]
MKRLLLRSFLLSVSLACFHLFSFSQDITGIWKGYFITDGGEQYRLEFQVKQNPTSSITGVSYSYLDIRFYGKATMTGVLKRADKKFEIQELRTVEVKNLGGGGTCLMNYIFEYAKSGKEEFLEGTFLGKTEDRKNPKNNGEWGDCGGGKVYLRKVQTSDFYVEPFLREKPVVKTDTAARRKINPTVARNTAPRNIPATKKPNTPVKKNTSIVKTTSTVKPETKFGTSKASAKIDTAKKITSKPEIKNSISEKKIITPDVLRTRENALAQTITVNTDEVTIKLYDNGEIDGDSISVFVDKQLALSHKGLSASPIILKLKFDNSEDEHEVVMVAENLGRIPPNTSLMVITAGDKRYQVQITSTEQKNAVVRFKYIKPTP